MSDPRPLIVRAGAHNWQPDADGLVMRFTLGRSVLGTSQLIVASAGAQLTTESGAASELLVLEGKLAGSSGIAMSGDYLWTPPLAEFVPEPSALVLSRTHVLSSAHSKVLTGGHLESPLGLRSSLSSGEWASRGFPGAERLLLPQPTGVTQQAWFTRLAPGFRGPVVEMPTGEEIFVVEGELCDEFDRFGRHDWLRFGPSTRHSPFSETGCMLYVARGFDTQL